METTLNIVSIIIIVFGILQIILFFKMWGMTNNVSEMKNMMELFLRKNFNLKENIDKEAPQDISTDNIEFDKENFPLNSKFNKGDIVLYLPEKTKLIVIGYIQSNIYKCKTIDGTNKEYCFQEEYLDKIS
nr:MAG TPA: hypothetical protein [Caudoviricetes sp.]